MIRYRKLRKTVAKENCKYKILGHQHYQEIFEKDEIIYINSCSVGMPVEEKYFSVQKLTNKSKTYKLVVLAILKSKKHE